jgi:hypothetical protein
MRTITRFLAVTAAAAALATPAAVTRANATATSTGTSTAASTAAATTPFCGIAWGSLAKTSNPLWTGAVKAARYGQHPCYDRLVFDIAKGSGRLGYHVRYVSSVTSPGSGLPVAVAGGARLQVTINAPATMRIPSSGGVTFAGWRTFRQLKWVGSFEGYTDVGLGVRARLPMRTFVLDNADGSKRLVVDVAHQW